jgi:phosphoglycolate phosphatase
LFDLDGTLSDPKLGITRCLRYALDRLGVACPDDDAIAARIGPPLRKTFAALLETSDAGRVEDAMRIFRERYATVGLFENELYDGVPEMLDAASRVSSAMFVATSKPTVYAARIVEHFGLTRYFRRVYGAELDGRFDDKVDLLRHLLAEERVPPVAAAMIGDRSIDVLAARANGVRSVGVRWGYGSRDELVEAGADALCERPEELVPILVG